MNKLFSILALLGLISCINSAKNGKEVNSHDTQKSKIAKDTVIRRANSKASDSDSSSKNSKRENPMSINLSTFTDLPKEIEGCACYFYLAKGDEKKERYIFVNDFAETAYISISGKLTRFNLISHSEDNNIFLYSNDKYILKVELLNKKGDGNEGFTVKGALTLKKRKNILIKKNFIGNCGC
jgi:hypothetical protein